MRCFMASVLLLLMLVPLGSSLPEFSHVDTVSDAETLQQFTGQKNMDVVYFYQKGTYEIHTLPTRIQTKLTQNCT